MPRKPRKTQKEWDEQKERIYACYITRNQTLKQTMEEMKAVYGFSATKREYVARLESWQMSKNLKRGDWKAIHERNRAQKQTRVLLHNKDVNPKKVKRAVGRYKFGTNHSLQGTLTTSLSNRGVVIRSPSPVQAAIYFQDIIINIPWFRFQDRFTDLSLIMNNFMSNSRRKFFSNSLSTHLQSIDLVSESTSIMLEIISKSKYFSSEISTDLSVLQRLNEILPQRRQASSFLASNNISLFLIQSFIYLSSNNHLELKDWDCFLHWLIDIGGQPLFTQMINYQRHLRSPTMEICLNRLLLSAISRENEAIVLILLKGGVDPHGSNGLHYQKQIIMDFRLKQFGVDITINPLQLAVIRGNFQICRDLLNYGANPNALSCNMPFRPLELAISLNGGNFSIAEILVNLYADINLSCCWEIVRSDIRSYKYDFILIGKFSRRTLLMKSVQAQNLDIARLLIFHGADLNAISETLGTAMQIAVRNNDLKMVELLLEERSEINIPIAMANAARYGKYFLENLENHRFRDRLNGVSRFYRDCLDYFDSQTDYWAYLSPLQISVQQNDLSMAKLLLKSRADINLTPRWDIIYDEITTFTLPISMKMHQHITRTLRSNLQSMLGNSVQNGNIELTLLLLQHNAIIDQPDGSGTTPLQLICGLKDIALEEACRESGRSPSQIRIRLTKLLLKYDSDINAPPGSINGRTALQAAMEIGDEELAELLLGHEADIYAPPSIKSGLTVLQAAAKTGSPRLLKVLTNYGANVTEETSWIALYFTALAGDIRSINFLLEKSININDIHPIDNMPEVNGTILQAGIRSGDIETVRILLKAGADIDMVVEGETAICTAAREGKPDILDMLIEHGASLDLPEIDITPLVITATSGFYGMVESILEAGADVNQISEHPHVDGLDPDYFDPDLFEPDTALVWALRRVGHGVPSEDLCQVMERIGSLLISKGAKPNSGTEDPNLENALFPACANMSHSFIEMLISKATGPYGPAWTEGHLVNWATIYSRSDIVQLLLEKGARATSDAMKTALFTGNEGKEKEDEEIARMLMDAGVQLDDNRELLARAIWNMFDDLASDIIKDEAVDVNWPGKNVWGYITPLEAAADNGNSHLVKLLLDRGARVNALHPGNESIGTALQVAVRHGDFNMTKLFMENGADVHASSPLVPGDDCSARGTALQLAAMLGRLDIAHLLLENDKESETIKARCEEAAGLAEESGHSVLARILRDYEPNEDGISWDN